MPIAQTPRSAEKEKVDLAVMSQQLIRSTRRLAAEWCSAIETCSASTHEGRDSSPGSMAVNKSGTSHAEASQPTTAAVPPVPPVTVNLAPQEAAPRGNDVLSNLAAPAWLQVVLVASVVLFCPLLVALMLALMLRRLGMQFRVEVINSSPNTPIIARLEGYVPPPPGGSLGQAAATTQPDWLADQAAPAAEAVVEEPQSTGEQFDLGPTYEEERIAKEESLRQQELAVLQEIFEQNVRLYQQIEQLGSGKEEFPAVEFQAVDFQVAGYKTEDFQAADDAASVGTDEPYGEE